MMLVAIIIHKGPLLSLPLSPARCLIHADVMLPTIPYSMGGKTGLRERKGQILQPACSSRNAAVGNPLQRRHAVMHMCLPVCERHAVACQSIHWRGEPEGLLPPVNPGRSHAHAPTWVL